jgi:hypothetical protein
VRKRKGIEELKEGRNEKRRIELKGYILPISYT